MKKRRNIVYEPNKAYLTSGSWLGVSSRLHNSSEGKGNSVWIRLELTPGLFSHVYYEPPGIALAYEKGYLEMEASRNGDGNIYLSLLVDDNMGDEYGFGVEPDSYLVGVVAMDGTFIEPLHIKK